jgi:hypothetical protein
MILLNPKLLKLIQETPGLLSSEDDNDLKIFDTILDLAVLNWVWCGKIIFRT